MQSTSASGGPRSAIRPPAGAAAQSPAHGPPIGAGVGGDLPPGGGSAAGGAAEEGGLVQAGLAHGGAGVAELSKAAARRVVDLRSDTVTKPTAAMREAMKTAEVDDDVIGVDPTVDRLQKQVAQMMGKEAGLFVPSGTMGNLICVLVHCEVRGSEVILGADSHISVYEQGGVATLGSVHPRTVPNKADGTMDLKKVELAIRKDDEHYPVTRLICLENTHNRCGGRAISVDYTERLAELASWYGLKFHIDGARIFNAAAALRVPVDRLVRPAHSVSVCLSKGLGAPAGSVIVGSTEFIAKARRLRKALGGSMRQVGVLAAAGLVALQESVPRLIRDHQRAMQLAEGLDTLDGLAVDVSTVDTNIVTMDVKGDCPIGAEELCNALRQAGVLTTLRSNNKIRMVTHYHITAEDIRYTLACTQQILLKSSLEEEDSTYI
ncbi:hypothetical protein CLOM_g6192 [Closterium sp. NIES-68]|nr:hypothetical protein CLOM_g6192 [Closterium sp. NIES-68]GJP73050.1 hypothetical protein CLOP_g3804 [Closterium sp. NIES-67]